MNHKRRKPPNARASWRMNMKGWEKARDKPVQERRARVAERKQLRENA